MPIKRIDIEINDYLGLIISVLPEGPNNFKFEIFRTLQGLRVIVVNKAAAYMTHQEAATAAAQAIKTELQQAMIDLEGI